MAWLQLVVFSGSCVVVFSDFYSAFLSLFLSRFYSRSLLSLSPPLEHYPMIKLSFFLNFFSNSLISPALLHRVFDGYDCAGVDAAAVGNLLLR